jgi:hypothetical protein
MALRGKHIKLHVAVVNPPAAIMPIHPLAIGLPKGIAGKLAIKFAATLEIEALLNAKAKLAVAVLGP